MKRNISPLSEGANELPSRENINQLTEQVGREILESQFEPSAWAKALYQSNGKRHEALGHYTRIRISELASASNDHQAKSHSFETRRVSQCMGDLKQRQKLSRVFHKVTHDPRLRPIATKEKMTTQQIVHTPRSGPQLNFVKATMPTIWLWILFLGTASSLALMGRLAAPGFTGGLAHLLTFSALLAAAVTVWGMLGIRQRLSREWIMMGWKPLLVLSCNIVCISSVLLSARLIRKSITEDQVAVYSGGGLQGTQQEFSANRVVEKNTNFTTHGPANFQSE